MPYNMTLPASLKKLAPSPVIKPSFLQSRALLDTEWAKPVVGINKPAFAFVIQLSKKPKAVKREAAKMMIRQVHAPATILDSSKKFINNTMIPSVIKPTTPPIRKA